MLFKRPDLTSGGRPVLLPDETLLFVQNDVGLYEGKYKIAKCQKGQAYLTSHRACYVDDENARDTSLSIDLREVDRYEFQAGFLRSSPKVTLYPKPLRRGFGSPRPRSEVVGPRAVQHLLSSSSPVTRDSSPFRSPSVQAEVLKSAGTWICPICSLSNPVPSNFDSNTATSAFPLPACLACGIKPPFPVVLKAAINAASNRGTVPADRTVPNNASSLAALIPPSPGLRGSDGTVTCPRCTFHNHPSLLFCEMCGAQLVAPGPIRSADVEFPLTRPESPGPSLSDLTVNDDIEIESVKFSFRGGGEKVFYERLKGAMIQRKWLLQGAPQIPRPSQSYLQDDLSTQLDAGEQSSSRSQSTPVGIAGLERRGLQTQKKNEVIIGGAFEDLEALMASAKDIVALAEKFAQDSGSGAGLASSSTDPLVSESAAALGMVTTKDMLGGSDTLYISELARNLAEYLTDDKTGLLRSQGGTMSLIDLWAVFNRTRNGVELISPSDFQKAAQTWERLSLPVRLREFKSGLLVVQRRDWNDEKTIKQLETWFLSLHEPQVETQTAWDSALFGCGVTAQEAAQQFGWSIGVAAEELEMAEDRGVLCREEGIEGMKFWLNYLKIVEQDELL